MRSTLQAQAFTPGSLDRSVLLCATCPGGTLSSPYYCLAWSRCNGRPSGAISTCRRPSRISSSSTWPGCTPISSRRRLGTTIRPAESMVVLMAACYQNHWHRDGRRISGHRRAATPAAAWLQVIWRLQCLYALPSSSSLPASARCLPKLQFATFHRVRQDGAYYGEFVQLERLKKNSQFGANRTVVIADAEWRGGRGAV